MYSEDSSENEEAGGRKEPYRRDSRSPEQESDSNSRSCEEDARGSDKEEGSEDDRSAKVSHSVSRVLRIITCPSQDAHGE